MKKLLVIAILSGVSLGAYADGHYVAGVEGMDSASVPPAGNYYIGYGVDYELNSLTDKSGNKISGNNKGTVTALANRFVHITDKKILGADYGVEAIVPVVNKDFDFPAAGGYQKQKSGVGDVYVGPLVLGWHGDGWNGVVAAGVHLDNGDTSTPGEPADIGNGYKGTMLTAGITKFVTPDKSASASALMRYEMNGKTKAGFEPGDQATLEWGIGKQVTPATKLGLVGYDQWQTTTDKGTGASSDKSSKHAVGLEGEFKPKAFKGILKAAAYNEYDVQGGTSPGAKGNTFRLTLIKPF